MKLSATILSCVLVLRLSSTASAITWNVPADAPTIQAGIDSASAGDTVLVVCGTYYESYVRLKNGVTLLSETGEADCVTIDAQYQDTVVQCSQGDSTTILQGFTITRGRGGWTGAGGMNCTWASPTLINCTFRQNVTRPESIQGAGGMCCDNSSPTLTRCHFHANGYHSIEIMPTGAGAMLCQNSSPRLTQCTFTENGTLTYLGQCATALFSSGSHPTVDRSIVAFSHGDPAVRCSASGDVTLTCCDVYGNEGGDWVGCAAGQEGTNGNFSLDPLFCDPDNGDFHIYDVSSCADALGCGLVGAHAVGCSWAGLLSISDVGNDQGRNVRVRWVRAPHDVPQSGYTITSYALWRRVDQYLFGEGKSAGAEIRSGREYPPGEWVCVMTVPASGEDSYATETHTVCDSTATEGICWSVFFVRGYTYDPFTYFDSAPDSGYSVDNLEPGAPENLRARRDQNWILLAWDPSHEEDFDYYAVYRGTSEDFEPTEPIAYSTTPTYSDDGLPGPGVYWYKVTATDFAGNESDPSFPVKVRVLRWRIRLDEPQGKETDELTAVLDTQEPLPEMFQLFAARPNPFNPVTEISYGIPAGGGPSRVTMDVFDALGRTVTTLVDAEQGPGTYHVVWDGRDHKGSEVASGVYFYRISWNGKTQTKRMVLLK